MQDTTKVALASLFALGLGGLPLAAEATTTPAPMSCQQQMAKSEGNCSLSKGKTGESHCTSKAQIRAHGGKCGKSYVKKHGM